MFQTTNQWCFVWVIVQLLSAIQTDEYQSRIYDPSALHDVLRLEIAKN